MLDTPLKYWHTVRHLKLSQVIARLTFKLRKPAVDARPAPALRAITGTWAEPVPKLRSMRGPHTFDFIGQVHEAKDAASWNSSAREKLWLYNLHYFDDLCSEDAHARTQWHRALIERWMAENPAPAGNGWEPYPTSLRLVNWIKWALAGNALPAGAAHSMAVQARWLSERLEFHLLANHLFVNAKALVFAGAFFDGPEADRWRARGLHILQSQVAEQVLADGGHIERTPMYHALILEDVLDLINAARTWPGALPRTQVEEWRIAAARMIKWLRAMVHPDGQISFFNDAAFGIAPTADELADYARRLHVLVGDAEANVGEGSASGDPAAVTAVAMRDTGYVRVQSGNAVLLCDVAAVGPDYQPGHAHADTLSFELSIEGHRVIVNSGTSTYAPGAQRALERATKSHSTVEISQRDSSEVWGGFRVARRARVRNASCISERGAVMVQGSHDGYCRLRGAPVHAREWRLDRHSLRVTDRISVEGMPAVARFFLHPSIQLSRPDVLTLPNGREVLFRASGGAVRAVESAWHPEFGVSEASLCLEVPMSGRELVVELFWS